MLYSILQFGFFKSAQQLAQRNFQPLNANRWRVSLLAAASQIKFAEAVNYFERYFVNSDNTTYRLDLADEPSTTYFSNTTNDGTTALDATAAANYIIESCNGTLTPSSSTLLELIKEIGHPISQGPGTGYEIFENFWRTVNTSSDTDFEACIATQMDASMLAKDETSALHNFMLFLTVVGVITGGGLLTCGIIFLFRYCSSNDYFSNSSSQETSRLITEQPAGETRLRLN